MRVSRNNYNFTLTALTRRAQLSLSAAPTPASSPFHRLRQSRTYYLISPASASSANPSCEAARSPLLFLAKQLRAALYIQRDLTPLPRSTTILCSAAFHSFFLLFLRYLLSFCRYSFSIFLSLFREIRRSFSNCYRAFSFSSTRLSPGTHTSLVCLHRTNSSVLAIALRVDFSSPTFSLTRPCPTQPPRIPANNSHPEMRDSKRESRASLRKENNGYRKRQKL